MFRVIDTNEQPNLVVAKNTRKDRAIAEAANKYRNVTAKVTLTIQKQNTSGKFVTVGTFATR